MLKRLAGWAMLLFMLMCVPVLAAEAPAYYFAYAIETETDQVEIRRINPQSPETPVTSFTVAIPDAQDELAHMNISPDGKWAVLMFYYGRLFVLVDMATGQSRTLAKVSASESLDDYDAPGVWSPDSRYFAFSLDYKYPERRAKTVMIYDTITDVSRSPFEAFTPGYPSGLAWSPDSTKLAMLIDYDRVVLISGLDGAYQYQTDFVDLNSNFCEPIWSPDSRYLSYRSSCRYETVNTPGEYHVQDTTFHPETENVQYVNHRITGTGFWFRTLRFVGFWVVSYEAFWLDETHLVLGSRYFAMMVNGTTGAHRDTFHDETRIYDIPNHSSISIEGGQLTGFARNPVTGQLAYYHSPESQGYSDPDDRNQVYQGSIPLFPAGELRVATWDGGRLTVDFTVQAGAYNLTWSADGRWLAYLAGNNAGFVDMADRTMTESALPVHEEPSSPWPRMGGWVVCGC